MIPIKNKKIKDIRKQIRSDVRKKTMKIKNAKHGIIVRNVWKIVL
jgi:hypothetical protein